MSHIKHYWHGLVGFLFTLWMTITHPIHSLLPVQVASTPNKEDRLFHPPEWDHSFSDGKLLQWKKIAIFFPLCCLCVFYHNWSSCIKLETWKTTFLKTTPTKRKCFIFLLCYCRRCFWRTSEFVEQQFTGRTPKLLHVQRRGLSRSCRHVCDSRVRNSKNEECLGCAADQRHFQWSK